MNRRVITFTLLSLTTTMYAEIPQPPAEQPIIEQPAKEQPKPSATQTIVDAPAKHPLANKEHLIDLILNAESRKKEIDEISTLVDSTISFQMTQVHKLLAEINQIMAKNKKLIQDRYNEINTIMQNLTTVDFKLKEHYADKLKAILNVEKFLNN